MLIHPGYSWALLAGTLVAPAHAQGAHERARDIGIPLDGTPGSLNAITDVPGVTVGHTTLIEGAGALRVGVGPVRPV
jgi:D-aminopeptidase